MSLDLLPCPQSYSLAIQRHQLRTAAAVIVLTVRRFTGLNGNTPFLAILSLSGALPKNAPSVRWNPSAGRLSGNPKIK